MEMDVSPETIQGLLQLISELEKLNPTPKPAKSASINGRWVLLYTIPDKAKGDLKRTPLQAALAASYDFFYKYVPIIAGSAVGKKAATKQGVTARGNFQTFDTSRGFVGNQACFEAFGRQGVIDVDGKAWIDEQAENGDRIRATFTSAQLKWGDWVRLTFPIDVFSPTGYIDTLYLDDELRISKGDKGSLFIARKG